MTVCDLRIKKKKSFKMFFLVTYELMNQKRISKEGAGGWNRLHIYILVMRTCIGKERS